MGRLLGKAALVTGGRQGIGRAIVDRYIVEGAQVMTCGRGPRPSGLPKEILWVKADVARTGDARTLQQLACDAFGRIDIVVNNAGIQIEKTLVDTTDDDWDQLMGVNAKGVFNVCRAMIPAMSHGGSIINIGSVSGNVADPGLALYNASKSFVHGLTRSVAVDHGPAVRCNAICPGWVMTEMAEAAFEQAKSPDAARRDALVRHPAGRFGLPGDVAALAVWLGSEDAAFATGSCFTLDGGMTAASPLNPGLF